MRVRMLATCLTLSVLLCACGAEHPTPTSATAGDPETPVTATGTPPVASSSPTVTSTPDVTGDGTGGTGKLVDVRLGSRDGVDRFVLEFLDGVPRYTIGYRPLPAYADGSGNVIPLPGATDLIQVTLIGATGGGWDGNAPTYSGPSTVTADTTVVTEAKAAGDFEAVLTWVVGVRAKAPLRVMTLDGPPRLVIDLQH